MNADKTTKANIFLVIKFKKNFSLYLVFWMLKNRTCNA